MVAKPGHSLLMAANCEGSRPAVPVLPHHPVLLASTVASKDEQQQSLQVTRPFLLPQIHQQGSHLPHCLQDAQQRHPVIHMDTEGAGNTQKAESEDHTIG